MQFPIDPNPFSKEYEFLFSGKHPPLLEQGIEEGFTYPVGDVAICPEDSTGDSAATQSLSFEASLAHSLISQKEKELVSELRKKVSLYEQELTSLKGRISSLEKENKFLFENLLQLDKNPKIIKWYESQITHSIKDKDYFTALELVKKASQYVSKFQFNEFRVKILLWEAKVSLYTKDFSRFSRCFGDLSNPYLLNSTICLSHLFDQLIEIIKHDKESAENAYLALNPFFLSVINQARTSIPPSNQTIFKLYMYKALIANFANRITQFKEEFDQAFQYSQGSNSSDFSVMLYLKILFLMQNQKQKEAFKLIISLINFHPYFPSSLKQEMTAFIQKYHPQFSPSPPFKRQKFTPFEWADQK